MDPHALPSAARLPIHDILPELLRTLEGTPNAVLVAPPGAGKTTVVPTALLGAAWRQGGRILMAEPRRLAARAAATRISALLGRPLGQAAGYRTRLDSVMSETAEIEVVTQGLLVRRLQRDPGLDGVACVIFDEVHERSLDADLALAFCLDLQRVLRPELRLLAMSATADGARLATMLGGPVVQSEGRLFPVTVQQAARDIASPRDLPDAMARAVRTALGEHGGGILAFLPGMAEIRRAEQALAGCGATVLPLHGDLPPAEQDRALGLAGPHSGQVDGPRRVVLATSIAETSLTVPGVRIVIDGGWRRSPRLDPSTGLTRLQTLRISRAAADQRAGRAGREAPGVAIRLWTAALHRGLAPFDRPEILEAELSGLALDCAAWGTAPADLPFADPPPAGALSAARALLHQLSAVDEGGGITLAGRAMATLGAHPRLAAMMLAAADPGEAALAADIAALLEERDPLRHVASADIASRLAAIAHGAQDADRGALSRIRQAAGQYRRRLGGAAAEPAGDPGALLAAAFPDRVAQRRGEPGSFRLSGGGGARLGKADRLANAGLLVVAGLEQKTAPQITLAAPLDLSCLPAVILSQMTETVESGFDQASGAVLSRCRRRYGALVLDDRLLPADPEATAATLAGVAATRLDSLPWTETARQFQARAAWLRGIDQDFADLSDTALAASVQDWLAPRLLGAGRLADIARLDMAAALNSMLDRAATARLDRELPTHLDLPGGRAAIDYGQPVPTASARAQLFYGMRSTPLLAGGRVKLQLALLSPAGRPVAITGDLAGFWQGAWADVRRDMRGRYPRHAWPENPGTP